MGYLSYDQARELTAEKNVLQHKLEEKLTDGEFRRVAKRITDITKELEDDLNERRRTGFDEARENAAKKYGSIARSTTDTAEVRDFLTPGSKTTDLWVKPAGPQTLIPGSEVRSAFLTTDTGTTGSGYWAPDQLYRNLVQTALASSGVLEAGPTIITTDHVADITVPRLTADATAVAGTEGSPAADANTTGGAVTLGAFRFDGKFSTSTEMLMSSELPLEQLLQTFAQRSLANRIAQQLALGAGSASSQCDGVFTSGIVTVGKTCSAPAASGPGLSEFIEMSAALGKGYRKQAATVVSDKLRTHLITMADDAFEYYFGAPLNDAAQFMGRPMYTEPQADQSGFSVDEIHAVHGDFSGLFVRFGPFFFRRSDADPLNPEFTYATWCSSKVVNAESLVSLKLAAS